MVTRQALIDWALRHGYVRDRFGHYQKTTKDGERFRLKFQTASIRKEIYDDEAESL